VTSILPLKSDHILTGSYDDTIRLIRLRPPAVLTQVNLEGGVWRLKLLAIHGENVFDVLASCMHAGTRIIRVILREERESRIEVLAKFEEHESMNYGSDFLPPRKGKEENRDGFTVISTSFYDRRVCLWKFTPEVLEEDKMENEVSYNAL
jgi:diphthamide biosynthesis protein 7